MTRQPGSLRHALDMLEQTGRALQKLVPAIETSLESWDKRISTGQLNNWLKDVIASNPPPLRGAGGPRQNDPR